MSSKGIELLATELFKFLAAYQISCLAIKEDFSNKFRDSIKNFDNSIVWVLESICNVMHEIFFH